MKVVFKVDIFLIHQGYSICPLWLGIFRLRCGLGRQGPAWQGLLVATARSRHLAGWSQVQKLAWPTGCSLCLWSKLLECFKTIVLSAFGEVWVFWLQLPTCVPGLTLCGCSILPVSLPVVTITLLKVAFQVKHREAWQSLYESFHFLWGLLS